MALIDILQGKKIEVIELINKGESLRGQWEKKFIHHINESEKNAVYLDQFLWHVFSYEKLTCLKEKEAIKAFNNEKKNSCYIFYQEHDYVFMVNDAEKMIAEDFNNEDDVYVVDKDFKWTYVHTHESSCGPYFYKD